MPYLIHLKSSSDLVTPYEHIRAGFLKIALEKNRQATPYIQEAKALKLAASKAASPMEFVHMKSIRPALLTASGLSEKALGHLPESLQEEAITNLVENFLEPAGVDFVDELVFRFLLTRGDSLGGRMRNLAGALAEQQVVRTVIATLSIQGKKFVWYDPQSKKWLPGASDDTQIELRARGVHWKNKNGDRTLLLNIKVPFFEKNVDLCLFNCPPNEILKGKNKKSSHYLPEKYLALGELKGGVDPAGADEHWKTANSALSRVRNSFSEKGYAPHLFFIGAAIVNAMAEEIFAQLQIGDLTNAANLTVENQLFSLIEWLVTL